MSVVHLSEAHGHVQQRSVHQRVRCAPQQELRRLLMAGTLRQVRGCPVSNANG